MSKKPDEINFVETDVDSYEPDEIKRAEDIIKKQVQQTYIKRPESSSERPSTPILPTQDKPSVDLKKIKEERSTHLMNDELTRLVRNGANSFSLLDKVSEELAQDAASLKFQQNINENFLMDTTKITKARVQALKTLADLIVTKKELAKDVTIDLKSKKVVAIFDYFFQVVRTSLVETDSITVEQREMFWARLQKNLENFEENAERVMQKAED